MTKDQKIPLEQFRLFYEDLYQTEVNWSQEELERYLDKIDFPMLTPEERDNLELLISIEEI